MLTGIMMANVKIAAVVLVQMFATKTVLLHHINVRSPLGVDEVGEKNANVPEQRADNNDIHTDISMRNGLKDTERHWPNATVPYNIDYTWFSEDDVGEIMDAMDEFHTRTIARFRPFREGDKDYVVIKGENPGCWTPVGRKGGPQVLNLNKNSCIHHGKIVHELLHILGFKHQQSAHDRDKYVKIVWENILKGHKHNFIKVEESNGTDFGVPYDYGSVLHYSPYAFTKTKHKKTIVTLKKDAIIGQRRGLSERDILKIERMYGVNEDKPVIPKRNGWENIMEELQQVLDQRPT